MVASRRVFLFRKLKQINEHLHAQLFSIILVYFISVPDGCTGVFVGAAENLTSPGYPHGITYDEDTECVWKMSTTVTNNKVSLMFKDLHADTNSSLEVTDLHILCGLIK